MDRALHFMPLCFSWTIFKSFLFDRQQLLNTVQWFGYFINAQKAELNNLKMYNMHGIYTLQKFVYCFHYINTFVNLQCNMSEAKIDVDCCIYELTNS